MNGVDKFLTFHPDNIFQYSVYFKKSAIFKLLLMLHPDNITQQTVLSKKKRYIRKFNVISG